MKMGDDNQNLLMALQFLINTIWREGTNNGARKGNKPISLKRAFAILSFSNAPPERHPRIDSDGKEDKEG
jgi:hypothetical protein